MSSPSFDNRVITLPKLKDLAFADKIVRHPENPNYTTKQELGILLDLRALPLIKSNLNDYEILTYSELENYCGKKALHLLAQKIKVSDDKQTEIFSDFRLFKNSPYLLRGYKMVGNPFWKFEATKGRMKDKDYLQPTNSMDESLKFMNQLLRGVPQGLVVNKFMHRKEFTLLRDFYEEFSNFKP
jgi:hypothetical protein